MACVKHAYVVLCPSRLLVLTSRFPTDATIAYKMAVLNCIKYLAKFGYTEEQVYLLLSCIPCEGRISGIVDVPNAVATLAIPLAIFDRDIRPPMDMSKLEQLASGIKLLEINVCLSVEGGAVPFDPRLPV